MQESQRGTVFRAASGPAARCSHTYVTAVLAVTSLTMSGCVLSQPGDDDGLVIAIIDGYVPADDTLDCADFHQHADVSEVKVSSHAERTLNAMRPGIEAVCSAHEGTVTLHHYGIAENDSVQPEAFDVALRDLEPREADLLVLPLTFEAPRPSTTDTISRIHDSGTVILAAAGNRPGLPAGFPASAPETISVGAADQHGDPRWYSPVAGVDVLVHAPDGEPGDGGTSAATAEAARILLDHVGRGGNTTDAAHRLQTSHPYERTP